MRENRQRSRDDLMLEASIPKTIVKMALPTIVAFLINSIYSLTDTYFVHFLGTNATAAVSVNASLDQLIMMAGSLMAVGAASCQRRCDFVVFRRTGNVEKWRVKVYSP